MMNNNSYTSSMHARIQEFSLGRVKNLIYFKDYILSRLEVYINRFSLIVSFINNVS